MEDFPDSFSVSPEVESQVEEQLGKERAEQLRVLSAAHADSIVHMDFRTDISHMSASDALAFQSSSLPRLKEIFYVWTGKRNPQMNLDWTNEALMRKYEALFLDMTTKEEIWATFWLNFRNVVWCERSVAIINTYATVYRQMVDRYSGDEDPRPEKVIHQTLYKTERILNLGGRLLAIYRNMVMTGDESIHDPEPFAREKAIICLRGLTYKYFLIKHNLLEQTSRSNMTKASEIRFLCEFELDHNSEGPAAGGFRAETILRLLKKPITSAALAKLTDTEIADAFVKFTGSRRRQEAWGRTTKSITHMCGECGVFEDSLDKFLVCGGCKHECYCSPECQKKGWKLHKPICMLASTTKKKS